VKLFFKDGNKTAKTALKQEEAFALRLSEQSL
jgi:hypothetical protein